MKTTITTSLITLLISTFSYAQFEPFVTTWKTDNTNEKSSNDSSIRIPTYGGGYNYSIDWNNDGTYDTTGVRGSVTHDFEIPGTYTIAIKGEFPRIFFNNQGDKDKIISIEQWGDIKWKSMELAFHGASNLNINASDAPDLSLVQNLNQTFYGATSFNQSINHWDISTITSLFMTFYNASSFNQDLNDWDVSNVTNLSQTFAYASSFNQNLNQWNTSKVTNASRTFDNASKFNGDIRNWDVSSVTDMSKMFNSSISFNQDISAWDVSNVTTMKEMFFNARAFNKNINSWNTGNVLNMSNIFNQAVSFNQDIGDWDVSNAIYMNSMFYKSPVFNQDIGDWDLSSAITISSMFNNATAFNQDISKWNVSNVSNFAYMFNNATAFNQDISKWNVSNASNFAYMFNNASKFDQNLGNWNISNVTSMNNMLSKSHLSIANYDSTLIGWANQALQGGSTSLQYDVVLGATNLYYCHGSSAKEILIENYRWRITDNGEDCTSFSNSGILPVELISFKGYKKDKGIELIWTTTNEEDNTGFEIQKSDNGTNWKVIDFVDGVGNANTINDYQYLDSNPIVGTNYYRLRQVDLEGDFNLSDVITVDFDSKQNDLFVFPNPSNGLINVRINNPSQEDIIMRVYDQIGNLVSQSQITDTEVLKTKQIKIEGEGNYFISIQIGNQHLNKKITVLDDNY